VHKKLDQAAQRRGQVVSFPPANEETGVMGHEIESHQVIRRVVAFRIKRNVAALQGATVVDFKCQTLL
jgi:hypothetical protein